jgi:cell division protein FtsI/penicillin-binding protein 2
VLDAKSGEVIAMASDSTYDPNAGKGHYAWFAGFAPANDPQ